MAAGKCDLKIEQGATWSVVVAVQDGQGGIFPLTGYTAQAQIRERYSAADKLADIACAIDAQNGRITLSLDATQTAGLPVAPANSPQKTVTQYAWDLKMTSPGGVVTRLLEGVMNVSPQVTHG